MADTVIDGEPAISAKVVSYWQGFGEMSKTLGMFTAGTFADRLGRKWAMIMAIVVLLTGSILEITANGWQHWLAGAIVIRLGVGLAQSILVTYISELAPFQIRGFMIGAYQLSLAFGQLIVAVAAQLFTVHQPTLWRPLVGLEFVFTGVSRETCAKLGQRTQLDRLTLYGLQTASLHHDLVRSRVAPLPRQEGQPRSRQEVHGQALRNCARLRCRESACHRQESNGHSSHPCLLSGLQEYEYRVIQHGIAAELEFSGGNASFFEIFKGPHWRRTLAGCVGICSQWAAGAPIVFGYSTYFFSLANL